MDVLMVGVGPNRVGGMWTVAEQYIKDKNFNSKVRLKYVATSTNGSIVTRILYMIKGYVQIWWILKTKTIDIAHIHMAEKGSTFRKGRVVRWCKKNGKKVIIHLHAGPFMAWYDTVSVNKKKKIRDFFSCADRVFVLGEYWKNELTEIIPDNKMFVLYNGVDCPEKNPYETTSRDIVYFGVMRKEKGTYDLIKAIEVINDRLPSDIKVYLCGNDLEGNIRETITNAGLENRFVLPGWVDGNVKEDIYKKASIDVLPSYYEGLSMTILEAMARGIPVITTNISTMPEVLGENGVLVQPGDYNDLAEKILQMSLDDVKRIQVSKDEFGRANVLFSKRIFIDNTLKHYSDLLYQR